MSKYILSTMTNGVTYCFYEASSDLPVLRRQFTLHGGAGIPSLTSGFGELGKTDEGMPMWTPEGCVTPCPDDLFELLQENHVFKQHLARNFVRVLDKDVRGNHNALKKEVAAMDKHDSCALLTPSTYAGRVKIRNPNIDSEDRL